MTTEFIVSMFLCLRVNEWECVSVRACTYSSFYILLIIMRVALFAHSSQFALHLCPVIDRLSCIVPCTEIEVIHQSDILLDVCPLDGDFYLWFYGHFHGHMYILCGMLFEERTHYKRYATIKQAAREEKKKNIKNRTLDSGIHQKSSTYSFFSTYIIINDQTHKMLRLNNWH